MKGGRRKSVLRRNQPAQAVACCKPQVRPEINPTKQAPALMMHSRQNKIKLVSPGSVVALCKRPSTAPDFVCFVGTPDKLPKYTYRAYLLFVLCPGAYILIHLACFFATENTPIPTSGHGVYEVLRQLIVVGFSVNITLLYWLVMYVVVHTIRDLDDS